MTEKLKRILFSLCFVIVNALVVVGLLVMVPIVPHVFFLLFVALFAFCLYKLGENIYNDTFR